MEDDIVLHVQNRIKSLLFDEKIISYCEHEIFCSRSNQNYQFLIWKLQPENWEQFSKEIEQLIKNKGYQCIPDAWDVSTYNPDIKSGYKVVALYLPNKK